MWKSILLLVFATDRSNGSEADFLPFRSVSQNHQLEAGDSVFAKSKQCQNLNCTSTNSIKPVLLLLRIFMKRIVKLDSDFSGGTA